MRQGYRLEPSSVFNIHRALSFRLKILDVEHLDLKKNGGLDERMIYRYHRFVSLFFILCGNVVVPFFTQLTFSHNSADWHNKYALNTDTV